ncbi:MAG: hypothetical protein QF570_22030 [Myxococcota bacterium]|nr:hypothetical protein [Myxococcota bacterium]
MSGRILQRTLSAGIVLVLSAAPTIAEACSVCMTGREDENRIAFLGTTVFLSLLPLLMLGGAAYWIWRRFREQSEEQVRPEPHVAASAEIPSRSVSAES